MSKSNIFIIVKTIKYNQNINHRNVQQSDYVHIWKEFDSESSNIKKISPLKKYIKKSKYLYSLLKPLHHYISEIINNEYKLNSSNINFTKINITKYL